MVVCSSEFGISDPTVATSARLPTQGIFNRRLETDDAAGTAEVTNGRVVEGLLFAGGNVVVVGADGVEVVMMGSVDGTGSDISTGDAASTSNPAVSASRPTIEPFSIGETDPFLEFLVRSVMFSPLPSFCSCRIRASSLSDLTGAED
jgi:hypothetical protein